ncbi:uncharacterized protein C8orf58 homolog [Perognathus longimembris pacificus]|uniref:uncharacterized protein C8orf58 homolog n=1 Tax=Perognathus longimembris pacificus TaxID=214514 RepID=UPI002019E09B|nr:uncharacterized protein C8orf58 homolog [Perognathus longimembris pacificus]
MLGRRRVFAVEPLGGRDGAIEDLAHGCVVPGATSVYRRIPDATWGGSLDSWRGEGRLRGRRRPAPLLKLASRDSGVEMVVGDSPLAAFPGLSLESLHLEPMESSEPAAQRDRLLASHKLERALERARGGPGVPGQRCSRRSPPQPERGAPAFATQQEPTEAETKLEAGVEEAELEGGMGPEAWARLPGKGLRYLEHLCLVLEQMARLQQLYLQLHSQGSPEDPEEEEEEEAAGLAHSSSLSTAPDSGVQGLEELLSQTKEAGTEAISAPKLEMLSPSLPRLSEAPVESARTFPPSRRHKDLSHWDKVKVLLNRIRWRSARHPEPPVPPDGSGPRIEPKDLSEMPPCCPHQKTFMPSLMIKKSRAKNLSVC